MLYNIYAGYYEYFVTKQNTKLQKPYLYQWTGTDREVKSFLDDIQDNTYIQQGLASVFPDYQEFTIIDNKIELINNYDNLSFIIDSLSKSSSNNHFKRLI